jgi:osmotically-inducible protein OsmY
MVNDPRSRRPLAVLAGLVAIGGLAAGCSPVGMAIGAGATAGVAVAEERPVDAVVTDTGIVLAINQAWLEADPELFVDLATSVVEGRVLVTGTVDRPEDRVEAIRLVWDVPGVRDVVNEVRVSRSEGLPGFARDVAITAQVRSRLTLDPRIKAINYTVDTVAGTVYLMGIAQDAAEVDRVIAQARQVPYVRRIVDYTRLKRPTVAGG